MEIPEILLFLILPFFGLQNYFALEIMPRIQQLISVIYSLSSSNSECLNFAHRNDSQRFIIRRILCIATENSSPHRRERPQLLIRSRSPFARAIVNIYIITYFTLVLTNADLTGCNKTSVNGISSLQLNMMSFEA